MHSQSSYRVHLQEGGKSRLLVSVIVPVYNSMRFLDECVRSILCQTYSNLELILIDDGSTDGSGGACDKWARRDGRVRVVHQANRGQSAGRNRGLSLAEGEYVLFIDSDDYVSSDLLEKALEKMSDTNSEVCVFRYALVPEEGGEPFPYPEDGRFPSEDVSDGCEAARHILRQDVHCYPWMRLVRSELYRRIGFSFPEGRLMEDMATSLMVLGEAERVCYVHQVLYCYRQRRSSTVGTWKHQLTVDSMLALDDWFEYILREYPTLINELFNYDIKFSLFCWMSEPKSDPSRQAHREEVEHRLWNRVDMLGIRNLSLSNALKLLALRAGVLGAVATIRGKRTPTASRISLRLEKDN